SVILLLPSLSQPEPTLVPYTTLFRSGGVVAAVGAYQAEQALGRKPGVAQRVDLVLGHLQVLAHVAAVEVVQVVDRQQVGYVDARSEEHTSELQSRENLVCRLLLEKKK